MMFRKTSTMIEILQNITPPPPPRIFVLISHCCFLVSLSYFALPLQAQNPPPAPANFVTSAITHNSVTLLWDKSSGATSYDLFVVGETGWTNIGDVATYTLTGLASSTSFLIHIRAKNDAGNSALSNVVFTTLAPPATVPKPPTNLRVSGVTNTSITLSWDKSVLATGYDVSFGNRLWLDVGDVASYIITDLDGTSTTVRVRAKNDDGISEFVSLYVTLGSSSQSSDDEPSPTPTFTPTVKPTVHTLKQLPAEIQVNNWLDGAQGRRVGIAEIAQPDIIAQGILDAVDVFGYVSPDVEVCFSAHGRIVFLDAAYAPRRAFDLRTYQRPGRTCALIDRAGTVVLLRGDGPPPPPQNTPPANTNPDGGRGLGECEVRPWANLKVRQEPPDGLVLGVTASRDWLRASDKRAGYFKVAIWAIEGWISGAYVHARGDCGA